MKKTMFTSLLTASVLATLVLPMGQVFAEESSESSTIETSIQESTSTSTTEETGQSVAEATLQEEAPSATEEINDPELEKALDAGYTKEQYEAIMQMPVFENEEIKPDLTRATLSQKQTQVVAKAKQQIGKPYAWGAQGPNSFDCGGLVRYVFKQAVGMDIPMGTTNQEKLGTEVSLNSLQAGDLLFYGSRGATTHVGIYIGNGQMIHAPQPGQNVQTVSLQYYPASFARRVLKADAGGNNNSKPNTDGQQAGEAYIFRMYNKNNGRHFYSQNVVEANNLVNAGWTYEGVGWVAPSSGSPVYRLYNPNNGKHHYTTNGGEKDNLVKAGWKYEQIAWYSGGSIPVYRMYNPNNTNGDSHHYTVNGNERDNLVKAGWRYEGIGWYAKRLK